MAKSNCNISFKIDYTSSKSITSATYSYKLKSSQNYSNPVLITPLPNSGDLINIPTDGLANGDYDLMITLSSGSVTTSTNNTFKIGNCPSSSSISVDAGPDQSYTKSFLEYGTPVLRKINNVGSSPTYGAHSASGDFFRIKLTIENGASTDLDTCRLYYKKQSDANWYSDGSSVYDGDEVEVLFTSVMSQGEPLQFKLGIYVNDTTTEIFSNVLSIIYDELNSATEVQGYTPNQWQDLAATSQIAPFALNLSGSVQNGGSSPTYLWELVSKPTGAVCSFGNSANLVTTFTADTFGTYKLRLSANNSAGQSASDEMIINLIQKANSSPTVLLKWRDNLGTEDRICNTSTCDDYVISVESSDLDNDIIKKEVFMSTDNGNTWTSIITDLLGSTTFSTVALSTVEAHLYKVVVTDSLGNTAASNVLSYAKQEGGVGKFYNKTINGISCEGRGDGPTNWDIYCSGTEDFSLSNADLLNIVNGFIRLRTDGGTSEIGLSKSGGGALVIDQVFPVTTLLTASYGATGQGSYPSNGYPPNVVSAVYRFEYSTNGSTGWIVFDLSVDD